MTVLEIKKEILKLLQDKEEFKDFPLDRYSLLLCFKFCTECSN